MGRRSKLWSSTGLPSAREWWRMVDCQARQKAKAEAEQQTMLRKAREKRRPKCRCAAYPWAHRPAGGLCRHPDPPLETWKGQQGLHRPFGVRRRGFVRTLCREYNLHPIRDRDRIARIMPWLYAAWIKRNHPRLWRVLRNEGAIDDRGKFVVVSELRRAPAVTASS